MRILDIHNPWRDGLLPASYKGADFHVEAMSEDNGRRIVSQHWCRQTLCSQYKCRQPKQTGAQPPAHQLSVIPTV